MALGMGLPFSAASPKLRKLQSLNLQFVGGNLDPRITFTRASIATYIGSDGLIKTAAINEPCLEYNPFTLVCNGLRMWEQRTNLLTYSNQFDNNLWVKSAVTSTPNATIAPDGTLTADTLATDSTLTYHEITMVVTGVIGTSYAMSVYAKKGDHPRLKTSGRFAGNWTVAPVGIFDLNLGTVVSSAGTRTATIEALPNGWYRCTIYGTCANGTGIGLVLGSLPAGQTSSNYDGAIYPGFVYLWGAQMEAGSFVTSYIPTVDNTVMRAGDNPVMTGTNFSNWYNPAQGTFLAEWTLGDDKSSVTIYQADDGTNNNYLRTRYGGAGNANDSAVAIETILQATLPSTTQQTLYTTYRNAMAYQAFDFARSADGLPVITDTDGAVPIVSNFRIGVNASGVEQINGYIRRIAYYPTRLSDAQLQALSA